MKFFLPAASSEAEGEVVLESICRFNSVPFPYKRIFRLVFLHNGIEYEVEVGKPAPVYYGEGEAPVVAILGANPLLICLRNRGVTRGSPILASYESVRLIEFFDFEPSHLRGAV